MLLQLVLITSNWVKPCDKNGFCQGLLNSRVLNIHWAQSLWGLSEGLISLRRGGSGETLTLSRTPWKEVIAGGVSPFPQVMRDRTRGDSFKLYQGRIRLDIRKYFLAKIDKHWKSSSSDLWSGWSHHPWTYLKHSYMWHLER